MDPFMILLGLIIWFFAMIGVMTAGKKVLRLFACHVATDPEGFKKRAGIETEPTARS